ncbi:tetratricopeptide repeat protein [Pseudomonas sp. SJZ079]|uniref:tetratricopeptide repeat protein n=1 Tax=Pseudomonas sp. SJZ079 TaxID=2572887 RepID=UPI00119BB52E|nr:tetratricopeptide repeat protein [Pseudomonas sp. SJZ079]TWC30227.1 tetratricopeptide repeat protein [Pseudomonas sp. SJZ079]
MDVEELIEKARDQRKRDRYEEAVISAKAATVQDPDNADGWWLLALSNISLGRKEAALEALKETNDKAPYFAQAWAKRGSLELDLGAPEEAASSFETALDCDNDEIEALRGLAHIYGQNNDTEKRTEEILVLTKLDELQGLSSWELNRLGILHFLNNHGFDAIKYWSRNAHQSDDTASLFNLGLAYNMDDVSQDVDAVDCWRLVMRRDVSNKKAPGRIQSVKTRLLDLARKVQTSRKSLCLPEDQWYSIYINPFQLLNCPKDFDFDDLEPKVVQKWKKMLLQEIELEEGKLHWMPGITVDRSKAIELAEKLSDIEVASYNWEVFKCKPLLEFLSKGDISHFLLDEESSPLDFIERVSVSEEVREWLSEPFSAQYDRVFSKAVVARDVPAIEALLDGRRWIMPSYTDHCFENALREAGSLLIPLRELKIRAETFKVTVKQIEDVLEKHKIISILNLLPAYFRNVQNEAVNLVRSIAIDAHNVHEDSELSLAIIEQSKEFSFKSIELTQRLNEDFETISEMIKKQREHECHLTFGNARSWKVTKEGVSDNGDLCPVNEIRALRWGIMVEQNGSHNYLFAARRRTGKEYIVTWTSSEHEKQDELFDQLVNAAFHYVIPSLMENLLDELKRGGTLTIGPVQVTQHGISFESKWLLFTSLTQLPWSAVDVALQNGKAIVADKFSGKRSPSISLRDVPNAMLLRLIIMSFNRD